jgi:hypothetical protein
MTRKLKLTLLILAGVAILAGAAYLAMIYVAPTFNTSAALGISAGPGGKKTFSVKLTNPTELPPGKANVSGTLTEKKDNSLIVLDTGKGSDPSNGVSVEVVVTRATQIYLDVTFNNVSKSEITSGQTIQMQVQPAKLEDIEVGDMIQAWGVKTGDRLVADQVLVMKNVMIQSGQPGK